MSDVDVCVFCGDTGWVRIEAESLASDDLRPVGWIDVDRWERCDCPLGRAAEVA